jgi:pantoate--beta-alanine ligase
LRPDERAEAPRLYAKMKAVQSGIVAGNTDMAALEAQAIEELSSHGWNVDYVSLRRQMDLGKPGSEEIRDGVPLVVLAAAKLGNTRLIDNLEICKK